MNSSSNNWLVDSSVLIPNQIQHFEDLYVLSSIASNVWTDIGSLFLKMPFSLNTFHDAKWNI